MLDRDDEGVLPLSLQNSIEEKAVEHSL